MKSLDDVAFAAAWVFLPLLPVTHAAGLVAHCPRAAKLQHILLYPFRGGKNHTIFQSIAWVRACRGAAFGRRLVALSHVSCLCAVQQVNLGLLKCCGTTDKAVNMQGLQLQSALEILTLPFMRERCALGSFAQRLC